MSRLLQISLYDGWQILCDAINGVYPFEMRAIKTPKGASFVIYRDDVEQPTRITLYPDGTWTAAYLVEEA